MLETLRSNYLQDLIPHQAEILGNKPYILFEGDEISFRDFDRWTRHVATGLVEAGAQPGDGMALLMRNCPEFLYLYHGAIRAGLYVVPVNIALKRQGLRYVLTHSDVKFLAVDEDLYAEVGELKRPLGRIQRTFIRRSSGWPIPEGTADAAQLWEAPDRFDGPSIHPESITSILYTSGTTGFPKGVVSRNGRGSVEQLSALASIYVQPDDVLYTALPLFHANALHLTAGFALCMGVPFALDRKFSASQFWDRVRFYGATQFNALGAMVPILMKQPKKKNDRNNPVRLVNSAACPAHLWKAFEKRFDLTIWEFYGAVDGGGVIIANLGNAPTGSIGTPSGDLEWKLVDDAGAEVAQGETGELVFKLRDKAAQGVEYYKDAEASNEKVVGDWLHTGDLMYADENRNLYFADRKTDSMRRRGENISSYEVENVVTEFPAVQACAAFGVPSDLGEDEVMIWVKPVAGKAVDLKALSRFCAERMAHFMVPRYVDVVEDIPQTGTLRVQKADMKARGVTSRTWDRVAEMPDFDLKA